MRKITSWIIAVVLFLGNFAGMAIPTYAAEEIGFARIDQGLSFNATTNRVMLGAAGSVGAEEAAFTLSTKRSGLYTLSYYINPTGEQATQVNLNLYMNSAPKVAADGSVIPNEFTAANGLTVMVGTNPDGTYQYYDRDTNKMENGDKKKQLKMAIVDGDNSVNIKDKELHIRLGDVAINLYYVNNNVYISTTGMKKDLVIPFNMDYRAVSGAEITATAATKIFKGLSKFTITPTHFEEVDGTVRNVTTVNVADGKAGTMPGVEVTLSMPKTILTMSGVTTFKGIDQVDDTSQGVLQLAGTSMDKEVGLKLKFPIKNGGELTEDILGTPDISKKGAVKVAGSEIKLYVSQHKVYEDAYQWDALTSAMIVEGQIDFTSGSFANADITSTERTRAVRGNTYPKVTIERSSGINVVFHVEPFKENGLTYKLVRNVLNSGQEVVTSQTFATPPTSKTVALTTTSRVLQTYQIIVEGHHIYKSQLLNYQPESVMVPGIPSIERIDNVYVIPDRDKTKQPIAIGFDIDWKAPSDLMTYLKDGNKLYYELYLRTTSDRGEKGEPIKVIEVTKEANGSVKVAGYAGSFLEGAKGYYNSITNTFTMEGVELKVAEQGWELLQFLDPDYLTKDKYPVIGEIDLKYDTQEDKYKVPGTYYLSMRAVLATEKTTATTPDPTYILTNSEESNLKSLSLNLTEKVIPTVTFPGGAEVGNNYGVIGFSTVDLQEYIRYMLLPANMTLEDTSKRTYEIYFYQDGTLDIGREIGITGDKTKIFDATLDTNGKAAVTEAQKEGLRNQSQILKYEWAATSNEVNVLNRITFEGLDPNQVYYVQVRVRLDITDERASILPEERTFSRYSLLSQVHSFTTSTEPVPPLPEEIVPPTPDAFYIKEQPSNTSVILGWDKVAVPQDPSQDIEVYYEFMRSQDNRLPQVDLARKLTVDHILKGDSALQASGSRFNRLGFETSTGLFRKKSSRDSAWITLQPEQLASELTLMDDSLVPNTIYYYYVRTVYKFVDHGGEEVYSEWIMVPVTTDPVEKPINLKVEKVKTSTTAGYSFDPKKETVISFYAPIPEGATIGRNGDYDFEIAVRGEKDEDFRLDYTVTALTPNEGYPVLTGYRTFVYRIEGLKPGSRYDIKVRVVDKTKEKDENGDYPRSLYSDQVMTRTEYDELEQEKDEKYEEYLKKYDAETEKLKRKPYWELESSTYGAIYKYRQGYVSAELSGNPTYSLVTADGITSLYYYLPADMLDIGTKLQTIIQMSIAEYQVSIRPGTLSAANEDIKEIVAEIKEKSVKDYYIALEMRLYTNTTTIQGVKPISKEIAIDMSLVPIKNEDILIEGDIMASLVDLIADERLEVIKQLEKEVSGGILADERLDAIITSAVSVIQKAHKKDTARIVSRNVNRTRSIATIDKPMLLQMTTATAYTADAYYFATSWVQKYSFSINGGFAVEADKLGSYIFTGKTATTTILPDIPGAQDFIAKYQLGDVFNLAAGGVQGATKKQVYEAVARILGAPRTADGVVYLQQLGIKGIIPGASGQIIRQDEAIYVIMQAYEKIYHKSVNTVYITNKQSVQNIGAFQSHHRNYVYAAVQLKVVTPQNGKVLPSTSMTVKEIIQMLVKVTPS